jgi:PKD repeat protein
MTGVWSYKIIHNYFYEQGRIEFEQFLREHPYNQRPHLTKKEWKKKLTKKDRPDLAMEQNFFMTMDPAIGRVPSERLALAYEAAEISRNRIQRNVDWTEHGPDNIGGRTRAIMFDPNDATYSKLWAGGVSGGLWYTDDITAVAPVWIQINDFWANMAVTTIAYDPTNTQTFYVGTGEGWYNSDAVRGGGIWKTSDGGSTWAQLASTDNDDNFYYVQKIIVHPTTGDVYAGTRGDNWGEGGVYRSANGGSTWTRVLTDSQGSRCSDLEFGANNSIYAATGIWYEGGVYKSTNGTSWTQISNNNNGFPSSGFNRIELATAPSDPNVLYAIGNGGSGDNDIEFFVKSSNGGTSWTNINIPNNANGVHFTRGQSWYDLILSVHPTDANTVFAGGVDLHKTTNSGTSWSQISHWYGGFSLPYVHADQHGMAFRPTHADFIVFSNDGGIHVSSDGGSTYDEKNSGYNVTQFYACAIHPTSGNNYFLAGAQDNGSQQFSNATGIVSTIEVTGGDGAYCFIDQSDPDHQITSYVYNNYYRSTNGGSNFYSISSDNSGRFINPTDYDDDANILYSALDEYSLKIIEDITGSYDVGTVSGLNLGSTASHIRISPFSDNTVFVGTGSGRIYKLTNTNSSSVTSTQITGNSMPYGYVSCIEIGANENQMIATYSSYGVISVWETQDGGNSWSNKEGDLPDMPVRWALYNPNDRTEVILATEVGVWFTDNFDNASPSWTASNSGLANVRTDMLQIRDSDNLVIAATHGRGLFSSDGFGAVLASNFFADLTSGNPPLTVNFTDQTGGTSTPTTWSWDFGDGGSSTLQNPFHTYSNLGSYTVSLTVTDGTNSSSKSKPDYISVSNTVILVDEDFEGTFPPTNWQNTGTGDGWAQSSRRANSGTYSAFYDDFLPDQPNTQNYSLIGPEMDFSNLVSAQINYFENVNYRYAAIVQNVEISVNGGSSWTVIRDSIGTEDSWGEIIENLSSYVGNQSVYVRYRYEGGYDAEWWVDDVFITGEISDSFAAEFSADITQGEIPFDVQFTDYSTGGPTFWTWDFGDGISSTEQNPNHIYTIADTYSVSLAISNGSESDFLVKSNFIQATVHVNNPPSAFATLFPQVDEEISTAYLTLEWNAAVDPDVGDVVSYTLFIGEDSTQTISYNAGSDTTQTVVQLVENGTYWWKIVATDLDNESTDNYGGFQRFYVNITDESPMEFVPIAPENGASGLDQTVDLSWNEPIDPDPMDSLIYTIIYTSDWNDANSHQDIGNITEPHFSLNLGNNSEYFWIVKAEDSDGFIVESNGGDPWSFVVGELSIDTSSPTPTEFALHQNYPNPFNPITQIRYDLSESGFVSIVVYDMLGQKIKTLVSGGEQAGYKTVYWDSRNDLGVNVSAGVYLLQIKSGKNISTLKMILLK